MVEKRSKGRKKAKRTKKEKTPVSQMTKKQLRLAKKIHRQRSRRARKLDEHYAGRVPRYFETWLSHPDRYDLPGVDLGTVKRRGGWSSAEVGVGSGRTGSGYPIFYKSFVVYRGEVIPLREAEEKGLVKVLDKAWDITRTKRFGTLKIKVPRGAMVVQLKYYRKGWDWDEVFAVKGGRRIPVEEAEKTINVLFKRSGKRVKIKVKGFRVGDVFIPYRAVAEGYDKWADISDPRRFRDVVKKLVERVKKSEEYRSKKSRMYGLALRIPGTDKYIVYVYGATYPVRQELKKRGYRFTRRANEPVLQLTGARGVEALKLSRRLADLLERKGTRGYMLRSGVAWYKVVEARALPSVRSELAEIRRMLGRLSA